MRTKVFFINLFLICLSFGLRGQTTIPGDSLVYGPMFSPTYNNSVRAWVLTKNNTGSGNTLSLSMTASGAPSAQLTGQVYNSDDRLGYSLRSYEFTGLTPGEAYTAKLLVNGTASSRVASITNGSEIISDFQWLSGGCGRIYDLSRCIDIPESEFHVNGNPEMFNVMANEDSDLMVWLGDATYLLGLQHAMGQCPDGVDDWANKDMAFDRYMFYRSYHDSLTMAMPQLAITDNHDTGPNEFDKNMPTLGEMKDIFMDWWPNPEYKSTTEGQGLFSSYKYKDVEYFLTDNRSFRDGTTQHFGPEQLAWLKQALLTSTATFKVIINGTPTFTPVGGRNFSVSTQAAELFDFVQDNNINGIISLSADIHEQRFMVRDADTNYPLYDILSGNINSDVGSGNYNIQYDSNNLIQGTKHTYLRIGVYGDVDDRRMKVEYMDQNGQPYFEEIIHEDMLTSQNADAFKLGLNMHNNVADASTYNHTINATNHSFGTDRKDEADEAMVFNATTSVTIPSTNALDFHNRPFSLTFWVNPSTISANGATILSNGQNGAGLSFGLSAQGKLTYTDHATGLTRASNYSILPNSWSYITWKYDNVKRKLALYYNGFLIQNWTNVESPLVSEANVSIGNNFENKAFIGKLDEVFLYGRLISDEAILDEADIVTNRGGVLKVSASQMAIPGEVINPVLAGDFTIEFWGKLNSDPGTNNKILASNGRINGNSTGLSFEFPDSNKLNVVVGTNASGWNTISEQGEAWNVGEWNHIALVVSNTNGTMQYYQNGTLIGSGAYAGYVPNSWGLGLGYSPSYNSPVQAELDDLRIWQRALTAEEIVAHRNHALLGTESDLAIYYDFTPVNENEDTNVISEGSVAYSMSISGAQMVTATSPIGNIGVDYQEKVSGKWSKNNAVNNYGLSFPTAITTYNANIIVGKKADTALEAVPGMEGKFYANGGWKIDPLNSPFATVKINLAESLTTAADSIANVAGQYYLLKKDTTSNEFSVVTDGVFDGSSVTFYNANLEEATYYLSWEESEFVPGRGGALTLSNSHDVRIHYTPVEIIMGGAHTFELWVNVPEDPNDKTILSNHGRINNNTTGFTLELESNNTISAVYGKNNNDWTKVNTIEPVQIGEWNHIAVTATPAGEVKIYLNGVLKQTNAFAGYVPNNTWDFAFGKSMNYGGQVLFKADEFRMWSEARTQEEIVGDMHRILETSDENLRFYYTFDQEDNGTLENQGTNVAEVTYTNASILDSASPVAAVNPDFDDVVSGSWSYTNEANGGMYVGEPIDSFTQNVIFGRSHNNTVAELPNTTEETFYVTGGWHVNALNMTTTDIAVALSSVFENVEMVNATVADYILIKGDPQSTYEVVASGATAAAGVVTFTDVALTVGNYYIAYEIDNQAAIVLQGGALNLENAHQVTVPKAGVNAALANEFTIELWGRLNAPAGGNTKLVGFSNFGGGEFGWEMEFLNNQTLQTITGKGATGGWNSLGSTHVWNVGEWNHVAVTFVPNGDFKFYINGELVNSMAVGTFQPCINDLAFGKNIANNSPTNSSIDEFRIWTTAKTQAQIQKDMYLTMMEVMPNLAYNYTFNQEDSGYLVNLGSTAVEVTYTNAAIIPATAPIRDMEAPFRNEVKGSWSVKNDTNNGMYAGETIADYNSNLVIGREAGEDILAVLGSTTTDTLYLNSRYKIDPLFLSSGSVKVDLSKVFETLNQANLIANEYFLLKGNPANEVEVLATGTKENNMVTFENILFDETPVYLAWKNINEYPIGTFPITAGNLWKYNDAGVDLGTDWKNSTYEDSTWAFGNTIMGYGDGVESTTLNYGPDATNKYPTYYFRHTFNVEDASQYGNLLFKVMKDDGVVVYVNGTEAFRMNMPEGEITYNTYASSTTGGSDEGFWNEMTTANLLQNGENVIAVELHQAEATSSDLRFDMEVNFQLPAIAVSDFPLAKDQEWYYFDQGTSLDATWNTLAFDNLTWQRGLAPLGYGDTVNTTISFGPDSSNKYITSYYAKDINVTTADLTDLVDFGLRRDDGAIVYVNGVEVFRNNMPTTAIDYLTTASSTVDGINENIYFITTVPKTVFTEGVNRIAVELHQVSATSSDTRFDLYIQNNADVLVDCNDEHIGCFTSIQPTGQTNNLIISEEHAFQMLFKQGSAYTNGGGNVPGNHDYTAYLPISGSSETGRLSVNHENTPGGVSIVDLHLNTTNLLWEIDESKAVDLYNTALVTTTRNCSGGSTPWGTVVTAEESTNSGDVNGDGYEDVGWLVEIDPVTATVKDYGNGQEKLWAMGRMNHENVVISADGTTAYYGEDGGTHCMYKYVMDVPGNLQAGTVYVLKLDLPLSGNDPSSSTAQWIQVPNTTKSDRNNLNTLAASLGGTNFNGVEDCEISPLDGKVYFAAKGRDRVYRFKDNGTTVSEFETFVGGRSYDITSSTGTVSEPWGDGNDNLVFDDKGNMWVCEDGGNNYIWVVRPDHSQSNPNIELFASMPSGSEPTGLTFTPDFKYGFFSVQHPSGSNAPQVDATTNEVTFNASAVVVFSLEDYLGGEVLSVDPVELKSGINLYPNPTNGLINILLNSNQNGNEPISVTVYDLLGRNILQFDGLQTNGNNQVQVDLTSIIKGNQALILQVKVGNVTEQFKVLTKN